MNQKNYCKESLKLAEDFLFIDEAGDLGVSEKSSSFFVFAAVKCKPKNANRLMKKCRYLFDIKSAKREIKFTDTSSKEKNMFFDKMRDIEHEVVCCYMPKRTVKCFNQINDSERRAFILSQLVSYAINYTGVTKNIIIDNGLYKKEIRNKLSNDLKSKYNISSIEHKASQTNNGLQLADMVAGAIRAHILGNSIHMSKIKILYFIGFDNVKLNIDSSKKIFIKSGKIKCDTYKLGTKNK